MIYGIDEYGRFVEENGERLAIEPWPYPFSDGAPFCFRNRTAARWWILRWHVGMIRQHGFKEWNVLRQD